MPGNMIIKGVFREHNGCHQSATETGESDGGECLSPGNGATFAQPNSCSSDVDSNIWSFSVWPYRDMEDESDLVNEAVSF